MEIKAYYTIGHFILMLAIVFNELTFINVINNNAKQNLALSTIPIFYAGSQIKILNSNCKVTNITTCNGIWSCSEQMCLNDHNTYLIKPNKQSNCTTDTESEALQRSTHKNLYQLLANSMLTLSILASVLIILIPICSLLTSFKHFFITLHILSMFIYLAIKVLSMVIIYKNHTNSYDPAPEFLQHSNNKLYYYMLFNSAIQTLFILAENILYLIFVTRSNVMNYVILS